MKRTKRLALGLQLLLLFSGVALAGEGVVALQTAEPSCPDGSQDTYVDCGNGTVTDNRTGLVWLKRASCLARCSGSSVVECTLDSDCSAGETCDRIWVDWYTAMQFVAGLSEPQCGLSDGSSPGEWRLPSLEEWEAMVADAKALGCVQDQFGGPSITSDSGDSCWREGPGNSFTGVQSDFYWSSETENDLPTLAYAMHLDLGQPGWSDSGKAAYFWVWPVRGGQ